MRIILILLVTIILFGSVIVCADNNIEANEIQKSNNDSEVKEIDVLLGSVINGMWPINNRKVRNQIDKSINAGVQGFQSYMPWSSLEPDQKGEFDWSEVEKTEKLVGERDNFYWQPFFMLNPSYAKPDWFKETEESVKFKCLEHEKESDVQSIWNPHLKKHVERVLRAFAEKYSDSSNIHSINLGVSGDFGETLYPAGAVGWNGEYHNHQGFWVQDEYAQKDYLEYLKDNFENINELNESWNSDYEDFNNVKYISYNQWGNSDYSRYMWLDQLKWYRQSMLEWTDFWLDIAAENFPEQMLEVCTGGVDIPPLGQHLTWITRTASKYDAGVRITNEGSDFARNFAVNRPLVTAARYYDVPFSLEPASDVTERGIPARIFGSASSGASHLHFYGDQIIGSQERTEIFKANDEYLIYREPVINTAVFLPRTYLDLQEGKALNDFLNNQVARYRKYLDFDLVDEDLIVDGILDKYEVLVLLEGNIIPEKIQKRIKEWVKEGGVFFRSTWDQLETVGGNKTDLVNYFTKIDKTRDFDLQDNIPLEYLVDNYSYQLGDGLLIQYPETETFLSPRVKASELGQVMIDLDLEYGDYPVELSSELFEVDGIFTSILSEGILLYNSTDSEKEVDFSVNEEEIQLIIPDNSLEFYDFN